MFATILSNSIFQYIDWVLVYRITVALIFGFVLGLEREYRAKPAGVKTFALICLGSTIITYMSTSFDGLSDPSRMAAQIVSGLGFIGAGAIFQSKRVITGLTTASSLWVIGALGIMIGLGFIVEAAIILLLIYMYFTVSRLFITKHMRRFKYSVSILLDSSQDIDDLEAIILASKIDIQSRLVKKGKGVAIELVYLAKKSMNDKFIKQLVKQDSIKNIEL